MEINLKNLPEALYRFEEQQYKQLATIRYDDVLLWPFIKSQLYFSYLFGKGQPPAGIQTGAVRKALSLVKQNVQQFFSGNVAAVQSRRTVEKSPVLLWTFSGDKLAKDTGGRYYNFLADGFVEYNIVSNYLYAEQSAGGDFREPSFVQRDMELDKIKNAIGIRAATLSGSAKVKKLAGEFLQLLGADQQHGLSVFTAYAATIRSSVAEFIAAYGQYQKLLEHIKPSLLICSEYPGSGLVAAAGNLDIPSIDLQHGVIDIFHPQYIYAPALRPYKNRMAQPTWVGVFGTMHRDIVARTGFRDQSEIAVLGSCRIEKNRERFRANQVQGKGILLPAQWTFFEETKALLNKLLHAATENTPLVLKLHPHEPADSAAWYKTFTAENASRVTIAGTDEDVYALISKASIVVGFDSAVLLEAVSLGKPCITITTEAAPLGIHQMVNFAGLEKAIRPVHLKNDTALSTLLQESNDASFYQQWQTDVAACGQALYAAHYIDNCKAFIKSTGI